MENKLEKTNLFYFLKQKTFLFGKTGCEDMGPTCENVQMNWFIG